MAFVISILAVVIVALGVVKTLQIRTAMAQGAAFRMPPEAVTTIVARQESWAASLHAIGSVAAVHGVTVSADLPGTVERISFDSGRGVREGDILVRLDTSQEEAQLAAAKAQQELTRLNLQRMTNLREKKVVAQAEYDQAAAEAKQAAARAGEIQATIDRKQIRAPFSGVLGIRQVNVGQYLHAGDPVVPLQSLDPVYVNFSVPQQDVGRLKVGAEVRVTDETDEAKPAAVAAGAPADPSQAAPGTAGPAAPPAGTEVKEISVGTITAINSVVDEGTRNVQVQATFHNAPAKLRPGMFVEVEVSLGTSDTVIALPAPSISYAPYGDSVFVVGDLKGPDGQTYKGVQQRFVKLGAGRGDQVAVVSGLKAGEEVVTSGVFKLRNGAAVLVNNDVQPANNPAPKPEDS